MIMQLSNYNFRNVTIFPGIFVLAALLLGGCGSDGDGEAVDTPATVPDLLNYEIRQVYDTYDTKLDIEQEGKLVTIESTLLTGSYRRSTEEFTLLSSPVPLMSVSAADFLDSLMSGELNNFSLAVNTTFEWVGDGSPTSGEFDLRVGGVNQIRVTVNPDVNNGQAGVDITELPDGVPTSVTWEEFDDLFGSAAPDYQQVAAFAHSLLRFMYEQGELVILALELISENDIQLEETGTVEQYCDSYSPLIPSYAVSYDPGLIRVNWYDADNSIDLGPGDTVYLGFIECWDNDETDSIDTFYDGTINLVNYTEVENAGVVIRIGFEPSSATEPGGIQYDYLDITETETTGSNVVFATTETLTLSGGFGMVFTSP
jgi:hypothetical protein